jgi:hypothetical protein
MTHKLSTSILTLFLLTSLNASKLKLPKILDTHIQNHSVDKPISIFERKGPTIQVAILLDVSNSMDGLINQTKTQIWTIINEISKANKNNKNVYIQVSLFEYGKSTIPQEEGYIRMLAPLTSDLDIISEKLFSIRTNGGNEYAGKVINEAVNRLQWSSHTDDLKLIIIAGNESFQQGDVSYKYAINKAVNDNIIVNTIFCGNNYKGKNLKWENAANLGHGKYMNISQNDDVKVIKSPYDDEINALSIQLNNTYQGYGRSGSRAKKRQLKQDKMASFSNSIVDRNIVKASSSYDASSWDIVSKYNNNASETIKAVKSSGLSEYKGKSDSEIASIIQEKNDKRIILQKKISSLNKKRSKFIKIEKKKLGKTNDLGSVLIENINNILKDNNFTIEK